MFAKIEEDKKIKKCDLYFKMEEMEQLHVEFKSKKIKVFDLVKTDNGTHDFSLTDSYSHHIVFRQPSGDWEG